MAVYISTVHLDLSKQRRLFALQHETFSDLVHQHEGSLVLHPQVTADLQS